MERDKIKKGLRVNVDIATRGGRITGPGVVKVVPPKDAARGKGRAVVKLDAKDGQEAREVNAWPSQMEPA